MKLVTVDSDYHIERIYIYIPWKK